jgi:hypothetical protein
VLDASGLCLAKAESGGSRNQVDLAVHPLPRLGPLFRLGGETAKELLNLLAIMLEFRAIESARHGEGWADDRSRPGTGPGNGETIPTARSPRPIETETHGNQG